MHALTTVECQRTLPLAAGLSNQGMALSVLAGVRPGIVVADSAMAPTAFCVGAPEGGFAWTYFAGDATNRAFLRALHSWIFEEKGLGARCGQSKHWKRRRARQG